MKMHNIFPRLSRLSRLFRDRFLTKRMFVAFVASLLIAITVVWFTFPRRSVIQNLGDSWVFKENQNGPVIGNLGGMPVSIPRPYAMFVEYDGDPGFMEPRKGAPPKRTYESRLRSFGFEVRYPDMAALTKETWAQKKQETIYTTTWMRVGVLSGSDYGGDATLDAYVKRKVTLEQTFPPYRYQKLPNTEFGLTVYVPVGVDESRRSILGQADYNDRNVYFHRDEHGIADTYIECSNVTHAAAPCALKFNMQPAMRNIVSVSFRKGLLPHWREIQLSVTQVILAFHILTSSTINPASSSTQKGQ